jgi:hypothetical protein
VRLLAFKSSSRVWAELHEKAFRRLGGTTRIIVYDFVPGNKIEPEGMKDPAKPAKCQLVGFEKCLLRGMRICWAPRRP